MLPGAQVAGHEIAVRIEQIATRRSQPAALGVENHRLRATAARLDQLQVAREISSIIGRPDRPHQHQHPPAADQAVVPAVVVIELKGKQFRAAFGDHAQRAPLNFRLDAAAAEGARLRTIGEDKHRGAGLLRRGAAGFDEAAIGQAAPGGERRQQLFQ